MIVNYLQTIMEMLIIGGMDYMLQSSGKIEKGIFKNVKIFFHFAKTEKNFFSVFAGF